ncbi:MAG: PAS domain S-box protein [Bacteroidetes bacterium]|nr:PAS domain S-box protein [Bacteroidota bacterium]
MILVQLLYNLTVLISLSLLSGFIDNRFDRNKLIGKISQGVLFGLTVIVGMMHPFVYSEGVIFDGRSILISLCTLFFGPISGGIAALMGIVYRISFGGDGIFTGLLVIISVYLVGFYFHNKKKQSRKILTTNSELYLFGLFVHVVVLIIFVTLPYKIMLETLKTISFTFIVVYPIASLLVGKILIDQEKTRNIINELKESEQHFRNFFDSALVGLFRSRISDGMLIEINSIGAAMLGYTPEEMIGKVRGLDLYSNPNQRNKLLELIKIEGKVDNFEVELVNKKGITLNIAISIKAYPDRDYFEGASIDISSLKHAQKEIKEKQYLLSKAQEIGNIGTWEIDLLENKIKWTDENYRIFGVEIGTQMNYELFLKLVYPNDIDYVNKQWLAAVEGKPYDIEHRILADGKIKWVREKADLTFDQNGKVTRAIGFTQDITKRKDNEVELSRQKALFEAIFNCIPDAIVYTNVDREIIGVNLAFTSIFGFSFEDLMGKKTSYLYESLEEYEHQGKTRFNLTATEQALPYEVKYRKKDGSIFPGETLGTSIKSGDDSIIGFIGIIRDITERKQADEKLKESEYRFRKLYEDGAIGMVMVGKDFKFLMANRTFCQMVGYPEQELQQLTFVDITHPDDKAKDIPHVKKMMIGEIDVYRTEKRFLNKDGQTYWAQLTLSPFYDLNGQFIYNLGIIFNITERKKLEIERQKFFMLAESSSEFIGMCDLEMNPLYVNPAGQRMVGLPDMEAACRVKVQDYYFSEDQQFIADDFFPRVLRDGHGDVEIRLRHFQTGEAIWMYYYLFSVQDDSGTPIGWATVSRDITERRRAEVALRKSEQEFRDLAESMPQIVWATRADGWNIYFNQQWVAYTGMNLEESYGHGWDKPFHPDDQQRARDAWQNAVNNKGIYSIEARLRRFDGEYRWWLVRGVPQLNEQGEILKWFGTCTDIDEMKQAETEIQKLNAELELKVEQRTEQLEASNKELEAFSYSVSHDLRAPLRHINGYVDLLNAQFKDELPVKAHHYLKTISGASSQMGILIDELLQYSRTGRKEVRKTLLDMDALLKEVLEELKTVSKGRKITLDIKELPAVLGDYNLLKLVWANLLDNAIKYTRYQQTAQISVAYKEEAKDIVFCVRDNGVGFDMKYVHKLFGVFQRLHSQAEFEGTGIGLANVQRIIHKHLGRVWAEAEPGKGAKFYFSLPKIERN